MYGNVGTEGGGRYAMDDEDGREPNVAPHYRWRPAREWAATALYLAGMLLAAAANTLAILAASALVLLRTSGGGRVRRDQAWR
jgi:hypothetical protein